ncbi:MAG: hypothetical protein HN380_21460 [Victivallales bacterium]|nr:hypothetical protein [Victivallales bacterium]
MSILTANLKHLYQRRGLWLVYLIVAMLTPAAFLSFGGRAGRTWTLLMMGVLGLVLGIHQREVASRPLSFLLPRHTGNALRQALLQGACFGGLTALSWLMLPQIRTVHPLGMLGIAWSLAAACYMAGTVLGFALPFVAPAICFLPFLVMGGAFLAIPQAVDRLLQEYPILALAGALALLAWSWKYLGRQGLSRRCAAGRSLAFLDEFNVTKAARYHQWRRARRVDSQPELGSPAVARLCADGIRRNQPRSILRYAYSTWYEWFGAVTPKQLANLIWPTAISVPFMMYIAGGANSIIYFIMPGAMMATMRHLQAKIFLPVGRRQRFLLAVTDLSILTVLGTVFACVAAGLSHAILPLMSPLSVRGATFSPQPFPYLYVLAPGTLIPGVLAIQTWLRKRSRFALLAWVVLFPLAMVLTQMPGGTSSAIWLALPPISLLLSLLVLRYHCLRRDLV